MQTDNDRDTKQTEINDPAEKSGDRQPVKKGRHKKGCKCGRCKQSKPVSSSTSSPADELKRLLGKANAETIQAPTDLGTKKEGEKRDVKELSQKIVSRLRPEWFGKMYGMADRMLNRATKTDYFTHEQEDREIIGELTQIVIEEEGILLEPKWWLFFMVCFMYAPPTFLLLTEKWFPDDKSDDEKEEEKEEGSTIRKLKENLNEASFEDQNSFGKKLKSAQKKNK